MQKTIGLHLLLMISNLMSSNENFQQNKRLYSAIHKDGKNVFCKKRHVEKTDLSSPCNNITLFLSDYAIEPEKKKDHSETIKKNNFPPQESLFDLLLEPEKPIIAQIKPKEPFYIIRDFTDLKNYIKQNDHDKVKQLLTQRSLEITQKLLRYQDPTTDDETVIHQAVKTPYPHNPLLPLLAHEPPLICDKYLNTPLMIALQSPTCSVPLISILLTWAPSQATKPNKRGLYPIHHAAGLCGKNSVEIMKLLISYGASPTETTGKTLSAADIAIIGKNEDALFFLLTAYKLPVNTSIKPCPQNSYTWPLHSLIKLRWQSKDQTKRTAFFNLIVNGLSAHKEYLDKLIHDAVLQLDYELTEKLLAHGALPHAADEKGNTPLHLLIHPYKTDDEIKKAMQLFELLIKKGASIERLNMAGKSALDLVQEDKTTLLQLIITADNTFLFQHFFQHKGYCSILLNPGKTSISTFYDTFSALFAHYLKSCFNPKLKKEEIDDFIEAFKSILFGTINNDLQNNVLPYSSEHYPPFTKIDCFIEKIILYFFYPIDELQPIKKSPLQQDQERRKLHFPKKYFNLLTSYFLHRNDPHLRLIYTRKEKETFYTTLQKSARFCSGQYQGKKNVTHPDLKIFLHPANQAFKPYNLITQGNHS